MPRMKSDKNLPRRDYVVKEGVSRVGGRRVAAGDVIAMSERAARYEPGVEPAEKPPVKAGSKTASKDR